MRTLDLVEDQLPLCTYFLFPNQNKLFSWNISESPLVLRTVATRWLAFTVQTPKVLSST